MPEKVFGRCLKTENGGAKKTAKCFLYIHNVVYRRITQPIIPGSIPNKLITW